MKQELRGSGDCNAEKYEIGDEETELLGIQTSAGRKHLPLSSLAETALETLSKPEGPAAGDAGAIARVEHNRSAREGIWRSRTKEGRRDESQGDWRDEERGRRYQCCRVGRTFETSLTVVIVELGGEGRREKRREGGASSLYGREA